MLRTVLLKGKGEDVTTEEGGELGTSRSISETSSTTLCATFVDPEARSFN